MGIEQLVLVLVAMDGVVAVYLCAYFAINAWFVRVSLSQVRREMLRERLRPSSRDKDSAYLPTLSLLIPAYNEEVTCVDSVRSLLALDYPKLEIIVCNDGSSDGTVDRLKQEFQFVRSDVNYQERLATAPLRALYQAGCELPENVLRLVLLDKENGGKADALNAGINASQGTFIASVDADSLLDSSALLRAMQAVANAPSTTIAVGTQVGVSNGSVVENGTIKELRLPRKWIARFQVAEYMRSFTQSRTALGRLNSLLILSGVFAMLRRDLVIAAGGLLARPLRGKVVNEYCGQSAHTVCEDMEIVVRMYRYALDRERSARVSFNPHPTVWTEVPESYLDLGRQRGRWYRGLLEVLWYHRKLLFNRRYKQIGMFAMPYQLLFEALAPVIEVIGYVAVPLSVAVGVVDPALAFSLTALALALNVAISTASVLLSVQEREARGVDSGIVLFPYPRTRDLARLLFASFLSNFGYRQFLLFWQLRGGLDFVRGRKQWDKFARRGFDPEQPAGDPEPNGAISVSSEG